MNTISSKPFLGPTDVEQSPAAPTNEPKSSPSPAELQANIDKGIAQAAQHLDQIVKPTLQKTDVGLKNLIEDLQNTKGNEDKATDVIKKRQESGDSKLQEAIQSLDEVIADAGNFGKK